jgi:hypothetical protein
LSSRKRYGSCIEWPSRLKEKTMKHFLGKLIVAVFTLSAIGTAVAADLTAGQVKGRLEAAGYTDVKDVRREGNHFDAKAIDRAGKRVSLDIDAQTGAVTPEDEKEGKDEKHDQK